MSRTANWVWWAAFITVAICVQAILPGLDVLVVGVVILLCEDDLRDLLWLLPLFILLQEGMGTRPFGSIIIWYAATIAIFKLARWLFSTDNFLFMFLLCACLGTAYYCIAWLMAPLQDLPFNVEDTLDKSLLQAIFMPFAWHMLMLTRRSADSLSEED